MFSFYFSFSLYFSLFLLFSFLLFSLLLLLCVTSPHSLLNFFPNQMFHALLHPTKNGLFPSASTSLQVETFIPAAVRQLFSCLYLLEPYGPLGKERKDQIEGEERTFGSEINKHSNKERKG